jgi:hypothetical protein
MGVLHAIGFDYFNLIADLNRKMHPVNRITLFDLFKDPRITIRELGCLVKALLYCSKEAVLLMSRHDVRFC